MNENTNKMSRRAALGTFGTVLATTAIIGAAGKTAQAQAANFEFEIARYRVYIYSAFTQEALIMLRDDTNRQAMLNFRKDGQTLPANSLLSNQLVAQVFYPMSRFEPIRDFLRYSKPVGFILTTSGVATLASYPDDFPGDTSS